MGTYLLCRLGCCSPRLLGTHHLIALNPDLHNPDPALAWDSASGWELDSVLGLALRSDLVSDSNQALEMASDLYSAVLVLALPFGRSWQTDYT